MQSNASSMTNLGAVSSGFEARRTRKSSGNQQAGNTENRRADAVKTPKANAAALAFPKTPKAISPRVLRPRNTPQTPVKSALASPPPSSDESQGGMKRKRGSIESAVASKMLRSGSKSQSSLAAGIARKNAGHTPARLGRK